MANESWKKAIDAQAKLGTIGQQWYDIQGPSFKANNSAADVLAYARSKGYGLGNAWASSSGRSSSSGSGGSTPLNIKNAVDAQAAKGGSVGQQWFNSSGINAGQRQAAMDYAASRGYTLGNTWSDEKNPIYNSAGDQVKRAAPERTAEQLAYRDQLKSKYGGNFQEKFVAGLMSPGQKGYDASTGGGNWVYSQGQIDEEAMRAWYRGDPNNGTDLALQGKNRGDFTLDGLYGQYSAPGTAQAAQENAASQQAASRNISKNNSLTKNLRIAQEGGISKGELDMLSKKVGYGKVVKRMDAMNKNGQDVRLNSGAANSIYKDMMKVFRNPYDAYNNRQSFGSGNIARTVLGMVGDPGSAGVIIKGQRLGGREATAGTGLMIGGTQIRKGGQPAVRRTAQQMTTPTNVATDNTTPASTPVNSTPYTPIIPEEVEAAPLGPGSLLGGGAGALGASKLGRARGRLRRLGISNQGTSLLNRSLQYGNVLNR